MPAAARSGRAGCRTAPGYRESAVPGEISAQSRRGMRSSPRMPPRPARFVPRPKAELRDAELRARQGLRGPQHVHPGRVEPDAGARFVGRLVDHRHPADTGAAQREGQRTARLSAADDDNIVVDPAPLRDPVLRVGSDQPQRPAGAGIGVVLRRACSLPSGAVMASVAKQSPADYPHGARLHRCLRQLAMALRPEKENARPRTVTVYIDYKSPYAYLAKDPAYELARDFGGALDWLPYASTSRAFSARQGSTRAARSSRRTATPHQWRRVKYTATWIAAGRRANAAWSSAARRRSGTRPRRAGLLYAKRHGEAVLRRYQRSHLRALLETRARHRGPGGRSPPCWPKPAPKRRRCRLSRRRRPARARAGLAAPPRRRASSACPSFVIDGELFWGREHLPDIREMLAELTKARR